MYIILDRGKNGRPAKEGRAARSKRKRGEGVDLQVYTVFRQAQESQGGESHRGRKLAGSVDWVNDRSQIPMKQGGVGYKRGRIADGSELGLEKQVGRTVVFRK